MPKQFIIKTTLLILFAAGLNVGTMECAFARWATPNDADLESEKVIQHIFVNKDATYTATEEIQAKILKENAKSQWVNHSIQYNADTDKIKIVTAKTIINGKEYPVAKHQITDQPIASNAQFFDQNNQIIIPYPNLTINASVYLKTHTINTKTSVDNFYCTYFSFGDAHYSREKKIFITSEIPLYIETNDPDHMLNVTQTSKQERNKRLYLIEISQKAPIYKEIVDEDHNETNPKHIPIVSVSSIKTFKEYGDAIAPDYEKVKQQPLPPLYQKIAAVAKTKKTHVEQINTITSLLAEKITYLADSRTIKGAMIPQPLHVVAKTRLGDCKDFSMATAVILQSLGVPSKIAFVMRAEPFLPFPNHLPGPGHLNHAIVKVELPQGPLWVDPTNFISMAHHVFPDIADRKAIVLDVNNSTYESIPALKAHDQQIVNQEIWDMHDPSEIQAKGTLQFLGSAGRFFTGAKNKSSGDSIKNSVLTILSGNYGKVIAHNIIIPDLNSRTVSDHSFHYDIKAENSGLKTNVGIAIPLTFSVANRFLTKKDTVSDRYLGTPIILNSYLTIKNISPIGKQSLDCTIESPWVNISRTVRYENEQAFIHQKAEIKQSWITGESLASKEYKQLQDAIEENFSNGIAIVVAPKA